MAIISSNSTGSFTFKSLNNNIVSVTGNTVNINGVGTGEIEITQAATSNFNEAKAILKVFVEKAKVVILDTDGDGVLDPDDFVIDDNRIFSPSQFRFDTDSWGTVMFKARSNGQLDEFYGNVGSGYITPELDASPIGWDASITWIIRTDASYITPTLTTGNVVELERGSDGIKNVVVKGTKAPFNVAENNTGSDRVADVYIDYYYKGKFLITAKEKIKQSGIKIISSLPDGSSLPLGPADDVESSCSNMIEPILGNQSFPYKIEVPLGTATGPAEFFANPKSVPDRFVLVHGNEVKIDTGYISTAGAGTLQNPLNNALNAKGLPSVSVASTTTYGTGIEQFFHSWTKTSSEETAYIYVYAPLSNTAWKTGVSCPNGNLNQIRTIETLLGS
tara:strand:+ start:51941 stop:53110 length:1170 start_codon:yes stop_codon:yes gene_type:complete